MTTSLTSPPKKEFQSFHNFPIVSDLDNFKADIAFLGIPFGDPYSMGEASNDQCNAPTHIRRYCERALRGLDRYDFDIGGTLLNGEDVKVVDCGDVIGEAKDVAGNHDRSEKAVRKVLASGAMPIILGGDHAIPIPVFRALENHGPITLVQVDAHIDWRDVFHGVSYGLSSVIRRASEMKHIKEIFQIGLRSAGSADGQNYYLTIDADGVDPTIMPAVAGPAPGGVNYSQMRTLIQGLVKKGKVLGMDIVEITPAKDVNGITAITAGRFICNLIGTAVRAGYFKK